MNVVILRLGGEEVFTAYDEKGTAVHLLSCSDKEALKRWKKEKRFYCPCCRSPLTLKIGSTKIPHFAHISNQKCSASSERESERHLSSKLLLYEWLRNQRLDVQLEAYLPSIQQRPDLLLKNPPLAIEIQCSPLSVSLFQKRTVFYRKHGLKPLWIYGGQTVSQDRFRLFSFTSFQQMFFQYSPHWGYWFPAFQPETKMFHFYLFLFPFSPVKFFGVQVSLLMDQLAFPFSLRKPSVSRFFTMAQWLKEKRRWISRKIRYSKAFRDPFLKTVYFNGQNPQLLHSCIGLPVKHSIWIRSHPVEWQYYLWSDLLYRVKIGQTVHIKQGLVVLLRRVKKGELVIREFPLIEPITLEKTVFQYFLLLASMDILLNIGGGKFIVQKQAIDASTVDKQYQEERVLLNKYKEIILNSLQI
jgi:competence protein CoiA